MIELKNAAKKFHENYFNSDFDFTSNLRLTYEWNDEEFRELINLIEMILLEYKDELVMPKALLYFFNLDLGLIEGIVMNPLFYKNPPPGYSSIEYKEFLVSRVNILKGLKERFYGKIK